MKKKKEKEKIKKKKVYWDKFVNLGKNA